MLFDSHGEASSFCMRNEESRMDGVDEKWEKWTREGERGITVVSIQNE